MSHHHNDVERAAVGMLNSLMLTAPLLEDHLNVNDKTPFTDGHVDLYSDPSRTKSDFIGRVNIQVKGASLGKKEREPKSFNLDVVDLAGYEKLAPVVLFVGYFSRVSLLDGTLKYAILNRFRISEMTSSLGPSQKSVAVETRVIEHGGDQLQKIFDLAWAARSEIKLSTDNLLIGDGGGELRLLSSDDIDLSRPFSLKRRTDNFLLLGRDLDGDDVVLDGDFEVLPSDYIEHEILIESSTRTIQFDRIRRVRISPKKVRSTLGSGISIELDEGESGWSVSFNLTGCGSLLDRWKDAVFFSEAMASSGFSFGGNFIEFGGDPNGSLSELDVQVRELTDLVDACSVLGVDPARVDYESVIRAQAETMVELARSIQRGQPPVLDIAESTRFRLRLGTGAVEVLVLKDESEGELKIVDYFGDDESYIYATDLSVDGEASYGRATPFDLLTVEDFCVLLNVPLERVVSFYEKLPDVELASQLADQVALKLLLAADSDAEQSATFLDASFALFEWSRGKEEPTARQKVNDLQVVRRRRPLTEQETREVRGLRDIFSQGVEESDSLGALAACVLLEDHDDVKYRMDALTEKQVDLFKSWPIYSLYMSMLRK